MTFSEEHIAAEAIKLLHDQPLDGRPMNVRMDRCVPAESVGSVIGVEHIGYGRPVPSSVSICSRPVQGISLKRVLVMLVLMICACCLCSVDGLLQHDDPHPFADIDDSFLWTCVNLNLIEDPKPECSSLVAIPSGTRHTDLTSPRPRGEEGGGPGMVGGGGWDGHSGDVGKGIGLMFCVICSGEPQHGLHL